MRSLLVVIAFGVGVLIGGPATAQSGEDDETTSLPDSPEYQKPFLVRGQGAFLGGYMDLEFVAGEQGTFDQHRFVPFIYAQVSDRVHVASEIEFEHGGFVSGSKQTDGEIKLEFATVDFRFAEGANLRGGVILSPLGRLNLFHDSPMLDLIERPLVNRYVIPTTLSEAGLGLYGTFYPSAMVVLYYSGYLVNGFNQDAVRDGVLTLRSGRGSAKQDNNNSRSFVGRLGVSPSLGSDIGVSVHTGKYDDAGNYSLTIAALDLRFSTGALEVLGEGALASAGFPDSGAGAPAEGTAKNGGFYVEGRYHLLAGAIRALPLSVFTLALRAGYVDFDRNVAGRDEERLTFGFNFRPTEETVFKNDLVLTRARSENVTDWGDTELAYRFSIATYF